MLSRRRNARPDAPSSRPRGNFSDGARGRPSSPSLTTHLATLPLSGRRTPFYAGGRQAPCLFPPPIAGMGRWATARLHSRQFNARTYDMFNVVEPPCRRCCMMLFGLKVSRPSLRASRGVEPVPGSTLEPTPVLMAPESQAVHLLHRARPKPASERLPAKEHALALLDWIRRNVDPSSGPIFHFVMLEYYTEMLLERGWRELKWNPVAHQFRLITTGNRKVYAWVQTTTGTPHRLRVYPIPPSACSSAIPAPTSSATSSSADAAPKLRRVA